jgi:methionyl-tRNA synthetase
MHKLCGGKVPKLHEDILDDDDRKVMGEIESAKLKVESLLEEFKFREALYEVIDLSRKGNQYMQKKEPWIVAKQLAENPAAQKSIDNTMHLCLQLSANLAILINPFLPNTAKKMIYMMKVVEKMLDWENAGKLKLLSVGYTMRAPELLFRKIEDDEISYQIEKLKAGLASPNPSDGGALATSKSQSVKINKSVQSAGSMQQVSPPLGEPEGAMKSEIVFDDFAKIDLKVGTIVSAEKVEKADKLLKLSVDLGFETRTIVSGIALHFKPEEIVGKQVVVVANLAPRKMRGIESNGMILMAEDKDGKLHFVNPQDSINPGAPVN